MPNTGTDALEPEFWLNGFDELDMGVFDLHKSVSRDAEKQLSENGSTVNVPIREAQDWNPGDPIAAKSVNQESVPVILNKSKSVPITLTGRELSMSPYDLIQKYAVPMSQSLMQTVNLDLYREMMKTSYWDHLLGGGTFDENAIIDSKTALDKRKVSRADRTFVMGADDSGKLLKSAPMQDGKIDRRFGFDLAQNTVIDLYEPGDLTGAIKHPGATSYPEGATEIEVDGFLDSSQPIQPGDIFQIAGEAGGIYHSVVTTERPAAGSTVRLRFNTPIAAGGVVHAAAITITPTRSSLAFHPAAVGFAARAWAQLPDGAGVKSVIEMVNDLPIRISVWHDGKLGVNVQYDILYGCKLINERRVQRTVVA